MKLVLLCILIVLLGCSTTESRMRVCKNLCGHGVSSYEDDSIECGCKPDKTK